jgi:hypothetical protein
MFNSHVLEVVAGLSFIFFVVSVFVSAVNEWVSAALGLRASDLETGLKNLLGEDVSTASDTGPVASANIARSAAGSPARPAPGVATQPASPTGFGMADALFSHPMIQNMSPVKVLSKAITAPAYLDAKVFSSALVDLIVPGPNQQSIGALRSAVASMTNVDLRNSPCRSSITPATTWIALARTSKRGTTTPWKRSAAATNAARKPSCSCWA